MKIFNIIITSKKKNQNLIEWCYHEGCKMTDGLYKASISHILPDLRELRQNTWDKNRVDFIIDWLESMVEKENNS